MRSEVARDLSESAQAFVSVVWPKISHMLGGGELIPVEGVTTTDMARRLDMLAGIDGWHVINEYGMRGIASRVQKGAPWASFTIRKRRSSGAETEWTKRRIALMEPERGWLSPHVIIQSYVQDSRLLYAAVVRTSDLFKFALDEYQDIVWESQSNSRDGNEFAVFWVPWLKERGVNVRYYVDDDVLKRNLLRMPRKRSAA